MTSWDAAARTPALPPTPPAPPAPRHRRIVVVAVAVVAALGLIAATAVWLMHVRHEHDVQRRTDAMNAAYAVYRQSGYYDLALQLGVAPPGPGQLAFQVCQARNYGRLVPGVGGLPADPTAAGLENAARTVHQLTAVNREASDRIAHILDADLCDIDG